MTTIRNHRRRKTKKKIMTLSITALLLVGTVTAINTYQNNNETKVIKKNAHVKTDFVKNDDVLSFPDYDETSQKDESSGLLEVINFDSNLVLVNKNRKLPDGYEPNDLVYPSIPLNGAVKEKTQMRREAAKALENMFSAAAADGYTLTAVSGYRSYDRQVSLYNHYLQTQGEEWTKAYSAFPGTSEHQTGLAMDVSSPSFGNALEVEFAETNEGKWLAEHAHEYGFVIRYPENKVDQTEYHFEPWHIRYVGVDYANYLYTKDIVLEEAMPSNK